MSSFGDFGFLLVVIVCCLVLLITRVFFCSLSTMSQVSFQRGMRDFEEFDEFACERFRLLPSSSSVSEINSLTRRLLYMS